MNTVHVLKLCILTSLAATLIVGILFTMRSTDDEEMYRHAKNVVFEKRKEVPVESERLTASAPAAAAERIESETEPSVVKLSKAILRQPSVHIFYYPWYGNPQHDGGRYYHWNHPQLKPSPKSKMIPTNHTPPNDIGAIFYPQLGPYSSRDRTVIDRHMKWISSAAIDVVAVSWYPPGRADDQGYPWDSLMPTLLNITDQYKMKLAFHLEPYDGMTAQNVRDNIEYIIKNYGNHSAFYRTAPKNDLKRALPLFYVYDSYKIPTTEWEAVLLPDGASTIRKTSVDALVIGLGLKSDDIIALAKSGFDGVYTYFAADGFTEGSTMKNWPYFSKLCSEHNLLFIPSLGPGYDDTRIRPWNAATSRSRQNGDYYKKHFEMAHVANVSFVFPLYKTKADILSITSFNEWHEGTQIEPAIPFSVPNSTVFYEVYDKEPGQYLHLTHEMINTYFVPHHDNIAMKIAKIV